MSKLNSNNPVSINTEERLAGGFGAIAAKQGNIFQLRRCVLANLLWEDVAYTDGLAVAAEIRRLIPLCNAEDVRDLALEARLAQKLRHTPLFLAAEMCKYEPTRALVADLLPKIITRADMLTDFLAIYWKEGRCPICRQAKKGLAAAFHNFNEYQWGKYDRDGAIKLRDVMFLVRPVPNDEAEAALFKKIANRTLATPDTWEVALSTGEDKKETWTRLISENKLGALAMLRNLGNMEKAKVEKEVIEEGLSRLNAAMLLPLDFLKAACAAPEFSRQIEETMLKGYSNLPKLPGKTLFIVDVSGSMSCPVSASSSFNRMQVASAMTLLASNQCENFELVCTAGNDMDRVCASKRINYPAKGFDLTKQINEAASSLGGGGIFTRQCLEWCANEFQGQEFDRIIIFSDSQDCDFPNKQTPKPFGKRNYICDISAHTRGVNYQGVWTAEISGWSEHFLSFIASLEGIENAFGEED